MPDPRLPEVKRQMLQEGFSSDEIDRALRDVSTLTDQQAGTSPSFLKRLVEAPVATGGAAMGLRGLIGGGKPFSEMTPQERSASQSPLSVAEAGRLGLPFLVNRVVPAGRTIGRIGGALLGNIAGSAALEGGVAAAKGEEVVPALAEGAVRGVPGGVFQGVAGGILGPSKTTIKAGKSLSGLLTAFSPEVSKVLASKTKTDLKALFSDKTIRGLQKAAGPTLDRMEATLSEKLAGQKFEFPQGTGPKSLIVTPGGPAGKGFTMKVPFEEMREEIKRLRNIGDAAFADPAKQFKAKQRASRIEQALLQQLEATGRHEEADLYRTSTQTFAQDQGIIRALKAVRAAQQIPGGLNRADSPIVAAAIDILQDPGLSPAARASAMSALALSGHPFMALHFSGVGRKGGPLDPNKVRTPLGGRFAGPLAATAGSVGNLLGGLAVPQEQGPGP